MKKRTFIILAMVVIVVAVVAFFFFKKQNTELVIHSEKVSEATVEIDVTCTGYIQPVDKVDVGTQVSGVIEKIYVDFNSHVKKGQLLAELDKSTLSEKLSQTKASLASAESDLAYAKQNYERTKQLYNVKAATQVAYEEAENRLSQAQSGLVNAKANYHQAQVNLSYAEIYSPIDGIVLNRAVEQGQTVAASFNTPTLFTIANDLKNMQVEADVDEADIGKIKIGQKVIFTVDSYATEEFEGSVTQLRMQPTVTSNVVTYKVIITAPNPDEKLFPGMTANVTFIVDSQTGLSISNQALGFEPTPEVFSHLNKNKSEMPKGKFDGKKPQTDKKNKSQQIWIKTTDGIHPQKIETGISDGIKTLVLSGLNPNDEVILSASFEKKGMQDKQAAQNPLMPKRPGRRGK